MEGYLSTSAPRRDVIREYYHENGIMQYSCSRYDQGAVLDFVYFAIIDDSLFAGRRGYGRRIIWEIQVLCQHFGHSSDIIAIFRPWKPPASRCGEKFYQV
jgi:hypothetical protein